ncbi:MAG TPA: DNA recombination protein RmuC [Candidatus Syntrophosphaera sp.]|jgi:DNA recombination protein RmuC|nr:DNA recombination protein RmuC [Candidatus Syntrophosphaera sp.]HQG94950.1 DNA recombination protein RmuC [Candidatus Syntrophosphaera sp.]HQK29561.1 DNA recombination protein RmuC [Candidatus Syntrophosphaera sp.]HRQ68211.1 DNA recombination protein RmuC [Candidatus Syntrophosphaera sp.]
MLLAILILCVLILVLGIVAAILLYRKQSAPDDRLDEVTRFSGQLEAFERNLRDDLQRLRTDLLALGTDTRKELVATLDRQNENLNSENRKNREEINASLNNLSQQINADAAKNRSELSTSLNNLSESLARKLQDLVNTQQQQFEALKLALEGRLEQIRANNETKLEEMRKTVDEKLHDTLEKRLGESFKQVSERLELVHKGLGEMQNLASGVGDLKKVLTNVKSRGMMGEFQLEAILEQVLTPEQYTRNFKPHKRRDEVVEFAIRLPGRDEDQESVYLPIDAKFPIEDYSRLVEAWDAGDPGATETARKALYNRILGCARDIRDKYLNPPLTTDFALLFLPVEGLYAEVLRDPALFEQLRRQYQVVVVGPTTVAAILNSLQLGFRTLAIEKRSGEVWKILSAVKNEFGKFGKALEHTQKKLQEASNSIDTASHRSRQIQKKLNKVQELPVDETAQVLELEDDTGISAGTGAEEEDLA